MKIEVCDICRNPVSKFNSTEVILKDYKGSIFDFGMLHPEQRKWRGVICDNCLKMLRGEKE